MLDGIIVGVDKTGCSGYAYKLIMQKMNNSKNFELIETKGVKVYIEPTATMFLLEVKWIILQIKLHSRFVFNNPNEKSSCGCGESFNESFTIYYFSYVILTLMIVIVLI